MPRTKRQKSPTAHIGRNVQVLRQRAGLQQKELADAIGNSTHATSISRIENGAMIPSLDVVVRLAEIFKVTIDDLVRTKPPEEKTSVEVEIDELVTLVQALKDQPQSVRNNAKMLLFNLGQGQVVTKVEFSAVLTPRPPVVDAPWVKDEDGT